MFRQNESIPSAALSAPAEHRMPALDGPRGRAVLAVMLYHFALPFTNEQHGRAWWAAMRVMLTGSYGVDMFFVLSGFLITGILLDSKHSKTYFRTFYMRRPVRIFPLYYGVLAVCFGLFFWMPVIKPFIPLQGWLWLYGTNFAHLWGHDFEPMFSHFWSLAIEEHFYLAWPIVVLLLSRRSLMWTCMALAIFSPIARCTLIAMDVADASVIATLTPCRLEGLAMGALLAAIGRGAGGLIEFKRIAIWLAAIGGLATLVLKALYGSANGSIFGLSGAGHFTMSAAVAGILVLAVAGNGFWTRMLSMDWLRFFGKYSYGLYVYHYLFQPWINVNFWHFPSVPALSLVVHMIGATGFTVVVSLISWHLYEKQFLKLKKRFEYHDTGRSRTSLRLSDITSTHQEPPRMTISSAAD